jgi:hypothetical protein
MEPITFGALFDFSRFCVKKSKPTPQLVGHHHYYEDFVCSWAG